MASPILEIASSTLDQLDSAIENLNQHKAEWVSLTPTQYVALIDETIETLKPVVDRWVSLGWQAKGLTGNEIAASEEWAFVTMLFRQLHAYKNMLIEVAKEGKPKLPAPMTTRPDGRVVAQVFPKAGKDKMLYNGISGEIWFNPGLSQATIENARAHQYQKAPEGRVALVLGAGNVSGLISGDFMHKLFVDRQVVLLKMNPVNAYLGELITEGYSPLVKRGFLQVVYGQAGEGDYLCQHPLIDELHMTGANSTYEAILFGVGDEGKRRKAEKRPRIEKRFTAELGNISPIIIIPGDWTEAEVIGLGRSIASRLLTNAGFNCLTPRIIIQHREWKHRDLLNKAINDTLAGVPTRKAYYPNADKRHQAFLKAHPDASLHGNPENGHLPWTYITNVDSANAQDIVFQQEPFCSLMSETAISASSVAEFISSAVRFANETVWGSLVASVYVHPDTQKDTTLAPLIEQAIADLRYGTVGLNSFGEIGYITVTTPWGGHSGSTIYDVQSGIGFVNNTLLFDESHIQKSVIRQAFNAQYNQSDPHDKRLAGLLEKIAWLEAEPSFKTVWNFIRALF